MYPVGVMDAAGITVVQNHFRVMKGYRTDMAYISDFTCSVCCKPKIEVYDYSNPNTCVDCRTKKYEIEKKAYMDKQKLMPLEKRVAIIEEYLYDSNIVDRLKSLELHHIKY